MHIAWVLLAPAAAYQCFVLVSALNHLRRRHAFTKAKTHNFCPGVSVLKPIRGLDPNTYAAFVSQVRQDYREFEILFGVGDERDPAVPEIRRLQKEFPEASLRLIVATTKAPNAKVGTLIDLGKQARFPVWVVNDSDIKVTPTYLGDVVGCLKDRTVGLVTCLYRVQPHSAATAWEAIGIATDFMPSTLVAQMIGLRDFGLGSTLAFRAEDLQAAGGFERIASYLADDYQLAKNISSLGRRALLSTYTVETSLGADTWRGVWDHQLRWARTIRSCKGAGFAGLPITHAGVWILAGFACGAWGPAVVLLSLRITSALLAGWLVVGSKLMTALAALAPVWDLYAFCVWLTSYASRQVRWRDRMLTIDAEGRIRE